MSYVDVRYCAEMHVAAMENPGAEGRYMSLVEVFHWNKQYVMLRKLYPKMPLVKIYDGKDGVKPTTFNLDEMPSLGVDVKSYVEDMFEESLGCFKSVGSLNKFLAV